VKAMNTKAENQRMRLLFISNSSFLFDPYREVEFSKAAVEEALHKISTGKIIVDAAILDAPIDYDQMLSLRKITDQHNLPLILYSSTFDQRIKDMALKLGADDYFHGSMAYTFASQAKLLKRLREYKIQWIAERELKLKNIEAHFWFLLRRTVDIFSSSAGLILCSPFFWAIALVREMELIHANIFSGSQAIDSKEKIFKWYEFLVLVLFSPILLIISLPLKIGNKEEYLFSTERKVGLGNKVFDQYKFKTEVNQPDQGSKHQPSLLGIFLIRTSLVNLPYLFNILKGDISFFDENEEEFGERLRNELRQAH
jgi:lipopolysaccharide/colanic/teichoic acid biosynthesis glycosyltransferase